MIVSGPFRAPNSPRKSPKRTGGVELLDLGLTLRTVYHERCCRVPDQAPPRSEEGPGSQARSLTKTVRSTHV